MHLLDLIGNTPVIELTNILKCSVGSRLFAKAEWRNPGGSLKDRPVRNMILTAVRSGALTAEKTILDSSSGNAGIAYSMLGAALGYSVEIVIPNNASRERIERISAHGATITLTDAVEGYDEALRRVQNKYSENPEKYWFGNQYEQEANWTAHYEESATELIVQVPGEISHFVCGVGTGGAITGIGRKLKEKNPHVEILCIRPEEWPGIEGLKPLSEPHHIVPAIFDPTLVDGYLDVSADQAKAMCHTLARAGIFVGQSSGAYVVACLEVAKLVGKSAIIATLLNDFGDRYFSSSLWS
jgi:cysteine synthase B